MIELDTFKIEVPAEVRGRHLRAVSARLSAAPRRRRGLGLVLVGAVLLLPLAAVAAESSLPGDLLYPVKRVLEPVRLLFDEEVVALNRIDELEILVERRAARPAIDRQVREAEVAVARRERPELRLRLDAVVDRIDRLPVDPAPTTVTTEVTTEVTTDTPPVTRPPGTTTTTRPNDPTTTGPPDTNSPPTTVSSTVPTRDSTRP